MIHIIDNRDELFQFLEQLDPARDPEFGKMRAQHMVEHLCLAFSFSNGKLNATLNVEPEKAARSKQVMIYTNRTFPRGIKVTNPDGSLPDYKKSSITEAIEELRKEIADFDTYFAENPEATPVHPVMGSLTHSEWIVLHSKHVTHHLTQFGYNSEPPSQ